MPREATGTWTKKGKTYYVRLSIDRGKRRAFALPTARNDKQAEQQTALLASLAEKLRDHGHAESCERLIRQATQGADAFQQVSMAIDQLCAGETEAIPTGAVTFEEFSRQWLNGELEKLYPGQLRKPPARLAPVIGRFENYIFPVCGKVPLASLTKAHAQSVMRSLPSHLGTLSRRQIAVQVSGICSLAAHELVGVLPQNPLPKGFIPRRPDGKARQWVYPDEEAQFAASPAVPLWFRVFCGFLAREGLRSEEARTLQWQDLDLKRGIVALDKNKTRDPRMWKLSDGMLEALLAWRALSPASDKSERGLVFVDERGQMIQSNNLADYFREQLRAAGITRELLYKNSPERKHIVIHDLRATFITMALVAGHNEQWTMNRTGHHSSVQINTYKREVDMAMALGFKQLAPLNEAIPELATKKTGGSADPDREPSARSKGGRSRASRAGEKPKTTTEAARAPALAASSTHAAEEPEAAPVRSIGYRTANHQGETSSNKGSRFVPEEQAARVRHLHRGVSDAETSMPRNLR